MIKDDVKDVLYSEEELDKKHALLEINQTQSRKLAQLSLGSVPIRCNPTKSLKQHTN